MNASMYFWRTQTQQEIDYVEEKDGLLQAFEFKYRNTKVKPPKIFSETYPMSGFQIITKENILDIYAK